MKMERLKGVALGVVAGVAIMFAGLAGAGSVSIDGFGIGDSTTPVLLTETGHECGSWATGKSTMTYTLPAGKDAKCVVSVQVFEYPE